jgi:hypothetical protein
MKNPILLFILALIIMGLTTTSENNYEKSNGTIGDVKYSILSPSTFIEENPGWVLMDGKSYPDSDLALLTGISKLPNATNNFIRGMSSGRKVGDFEKYRTALPYLDFKIEVKSNGKHSHNFDFGRSDKAAGSQFDKTRFIDLDISNDGGRIWTEDAGRHSHTAKISGGDYETRPDNIALYVYIKINN